MSGVLDSFRLDGRVALVTGGGGGGLLGRQMVEALAEAGATVVVTSRDAQSLNVVCGAWQQRGLRVIAETLDQGDPDSVFALRDRILAEHDHLDLLVNKAVSRPMSDWGVNSDNETSNIVHLRHRDDVDLVLITVPDIYGTFGVVQMAGNKCTIQARMDDTFTAFKGNYKLSSTTCVSACPTEIRGGMFLSLFIYRRDG